MNKQCKLDNFIERHITIKKRVFHKDFTHVKNASTCNNFSNNNNQNKTLLKLATFEEDKIDHRPRKNIRPALF